MYGVTSGWARDGRRPPGARPAARTTALRATTLGRNADHQCPPRGSGRWRAGAAELRMTQHRMRPAKLRQRGQPRRSPAQVMRMGADLDAFESVPRVDQPRRAVKMYCKIA